MHNFKLMRVDAKTGQTVLLAENLSEERAHKRAYQLEKREIMKPVRQYWFASGNIKEYKDYGQRFLEYRKTLKP
jgi:hypothetical protein